SAASRRPGARRRRAGHRPVSDGERALRRDGTARHRLVHGLRAAARGRHQDLDRMVEPSGAGDHQSARRQGLRRGRLRWRADLGDERGRGRAAAARHPSLRHAGEPAARLGRNSGTEPELLVAVAVVVAVLVAAASAVLVLVFVLVPALVLAVVVALVIARGAGCGAAVVLPVAVLAILLRRAAARGRLAIGIARADLLVLLGARAYGVLVLPAGLLGRG